VSKIFQIYDGRTGFWQGDIRQKLIVLDKAITEVHFANKDMKYAIPSKVYTDNGITLCKIPDVFFRFARNLTVYACVNGATIGAVKYAVMSRPLVNYTIEQPEAMYDIVKRLEMVEAAIAQGMKTLKRFNSVEDAELWAKQEGQPGVIVIINVQGNLVAHMVEDDYSVTPMCSCDEYDDITDVKIWDGGGAAGL
jgi:hypothetical protein